MPEFPRGSGLLKTIYFNHITQINQKKCLAKSGHGTSGSDVTNHNVDAHKIDPKSTPLTYIHTEKEAKT